MSVHHRTPADVGFVLFEWLGRLFHGVSHIYGIERQLALSHLGGIKRFQEVIVKGGILLWQTERLMCFAVLVNITEVGLAV